MTKNIKFVITRFVFQAQKSAGAQPRTPLAAGGAYNAPPDPLVGWGGGCPLPIPLPARTRCLRSQAPSTQNPGYASDFSLT